MKLHTRSKGPLWLTRWTDDDPGGGARSDGGMVERVERRTLPKSARNAASRLLRELGASVQLTFAPYPKTGGWTFDFQTQ